MKIVVFGNSLLTIPTFQALAQQGLVAGLCVPAIQSPDSGRIRFIAEALGVSLLVVEQRDLLGKLKNWLKRLSPDVALVLTFSYRLPRQILEIPPLGFYNFHFARLPEYRGPAPVFWEIARQEPVGAISVHKMDEKLDQGPITLVREIPIEPEDTYGLHLVKLAFSAVEVAHKLLLRLQADPAGIELHVQDQTRARTYPRPQQDDLTIDWSHQDGNSVRALIKAANPWNSGAFATIKGVNLRIVEATLLEGGLDPAVGGTIYTADESNGLTVCCRDGKLLRVDIVFMEEGYLLGEKLIGLGIRPGDRFEAAAML